MNRQKKIQREKQIKYLIYDYAQKAGGFSWDNETCYVALVLISITVGCRYDEVKRIYQNMLFDLNKI